MKKLFGEIDLTWKKLIIFAVLTAVYTALMAIIPFTKDTSFRDISVYMEWWILFGIIIISNSKSPKDSALKCFVFFLISQPLIYLLQVPFSSIGWQIFGYYKHWFILTLCTIPMGFVGHYIKKKNLVSLIILIPMLMLIAYFGLIYFSELRDNFPHHLLSLIACILMIIVIVINFLDKKIFRFIAFTLVIVFIGAFVLLNSNFNNKAFETYQTLDQYNIDFDGKLEITNFSKNEDGSVEMIANTKNLHSIKMKGTYTGNYFFTIKDKSGKEYKFEYHYDKKTKSVVLNEVK